MRYGKCRDCGKEIHKKDNPVRFYDLELEKELWICKVCWDGLDEEGLIEK